MPPLLSCWSTPLAYDLMYFTAGPAKPCLGLETSAPYVTRPHFHEVMLLHVMDLVTPWDRAPIPQTSVVGSTREPNGLLCSTH